MSLCHSHLVLMGHLAQNLTVQGHSSETDISSSSQKFSLLLWNLYVRHHVYKSLPVFLSWTRWNESTFFHHIVKFRFNIISPTCLGLHKKLLTFRFCHWNCVFISIFHACSMICSYHPCFDHTDDIWRGSETTEPVRHVGRCTLTVNLLAYWLVTARIINSSPTAVPLH